MTRPDLSSQAGFTLAETMVALFILALLSAAGSSLLLGATGTNRQLSDREAEIREIDLAQALIRNDIIEISPRAVRSVDGFQTITNLSGEARFSEGQVLQFVRSGWINPAGLDARSNLQAVQYSLEDEALVRVASVRPDEVNATPQSRRVLFKDVVSVVPRFQSRGAWVDEWGVLGRSAGSDLPQLIELEINFLDETKLTLVALTGQGG